MIFKVALMETLYYTACVIFITPLNVSLWKWKRQQFHWSIFRQYIVFLIQIIFSLFSFLANIVFECFKNILQNLHLPEPVSVLANHLFTLKKVFFPRNIDLKAFYFIECYNSIKRDYSNRKECRNRHNLRNQALNKILLFHFTFLILLPCFVSFTFCSKKSLFNARFLIFPTLADFSSLARCFGQLKMPIVREANFKKRSNIKKSIVNDFTLVKMKATWSA